MEDYKKNRYGWGHFIGKEINLLTGEETCVIILIHADPHCNI